MCSGSEAGSDLRLIDFVYHSTLGLRVIKKRKKFRGASAAAADERVRAKSWAAWVQGPGLGKQDSQCEHASGGYRVQVCCWVCGVCLGFLPPADDNHLGRCEFVVGERPPLVQYRQVPAGCRGGKLIEVVPPPKNLGVAPKP